MIIRKLYLVRYLNGADPTVPLSISYIITSFARVDVNKTQQKTTKHCMFENLKSPGSVFNDLRGCGMKMLCFSHSAPLPWLTWLGYGKKKSACPFGIGLKHKMIQRDTSFFFRQMSQNISKCLIAPAPKLRISLKTRAQNNGGRATEPVFPPAPAGLQGGQRTWGIKANAANGIHPSFFPTPCMSLQKLARRRADRRRPSKTQHYTTKHTTIRNNTQPF